MHALRRARLLTCLVVALLWSVLGWSALAPVWASSSPQLLGAICAAAPDRAGSALGADRASLDEGGTASDATGLLASLHSLDCALCLPFAAPPGASQAHFPAATVANAQTPTDDALEPHTAPAWRWSARGPPRSA